MAIIKRLVKGSALTHAELDGNFTDIEGQLAGKAPTANPTFTGTPAAPTAAAATNTTQLATTAFVRTEIANLLNSAPGTLDTLDELAAALGDDPNFAATTAASIALKAPINSPTFTGTVAGITKAMVGLGNVDNTSNATERAATATLANKTLAAPVITGVSTYSGAVNLVETALGDFVAHTADGPQLTSTMTAGATLTFDATPSDGRVFGPIRVPANSGGPYTLTIPSSVNATTGATITTVSVPASGQVELTFRRIGATNYVYGVPASAGASTALADITDMSANARTFNAAADYAAMVNALGGASSTGSGGLVRATSPTLVTPALGTPASGVLTSCTGFPLGSIGTGLGTTGSVALNFATLTGTRQSITATGNITFTTSNLAAGRGLELRISAGGSTRTLTWPAWVAFGAALPTSLASGATIIVSLFANSTTDGSVDAVAVVSA